MTTQNPDPRKPDPVIGVVGPCTSGKTTLIRSLFLRGISARHIAQEHSYVPYMWQRITNPDILIFLDVTFPVSLQRRKMNWNLDEFMEQQRRLAHARAHASFYMLTDPFNENEVAEQVIAYLSAFNISIPH